MPIILAVFLHSKSKLSQREVLKNTTSVQWSVIRLNGQGLPSGEQKTVAQHALSDITSSQACKIVDEMAPLRDIIRYGL